MNDRTRKNSFDHISDGTAKAPFPELNLLTTVFRRYPEIQAVYMFGSAATGTAGVGSDLDIGILPKNASVHAKKLDILSDLAALGFCEVDIVFLDIEDIVLKFEIVKHNKVIYRTSDFDVGGFYSKVLRMYFDFLPYLTVHREAFKRRILDGKLRNLS